MFGLKDSDLHQFRDILIDKVWFYYYNSYGYNKFDSEILEIEINPIFDIVTD